MNRKQRRKKMQPGNNGMPMPMQGGQNPNPEDRAKAQQAMQMMAQMSQRIKDQQEAESLIKPTSQNLSESGFITWNWDLPNARWIEAKLTKSDLGYEILFFGDWTPVASRSEERRVG